MLCRNKGTGQETGEVGFGNNVLIKTNLKIGIIVFNVIVGYNSIKVIFFDLIKIDL